MAVINNVLSAVGAVTLTYATYKLIQSFLEAIRPSSLPKYLHCKEGSWALVTGASDGIGRGFVDELLTRGFDVILHGRNEEKLTRLARELRATYNERRRVEIVVAQATDVSQDFKSIVSKLEQLPGKLTVLVNNVGGIHSQRVYQVLEQMPPQDILDCINLNNSFPTLLTSALLPMLKMNAPSLILNCGSLAYLMTPPYISIYAGTKGFINAWSGALRAENINSGVEVLTVAIGNTTSAGNQVHEKGITISSRECAKSSLDKVGCGHDVVIPHWRHALSVLPLVLLPTTFIKKQMMPIVKRRYDAEELASARKEL